MSEEIEQENAQVGVDSAHHLVRVSWTDLDEGRIGERRSTTISPEEAIRLATNLISSAQAAMSRIALDALAGECETCGNLRLVQKTMPGHRHASSIHCPACSPDGRRPLPPTLAFWRESEARLLR